jgi:hypothetical protein
MVRLRAHTVVMAFGAVGVALLFALKPTTTPVYAGSKPAIQDAKPSVPAAPPSAQAKSARDKPAPGGCPPEMARVEHACVDRYEARLLRKNEDGSLEPHAPV